MIALESGWLEIARLLLAGGTLVSSTRCSHEEIVIAKAVRRYFVDRNGFTYVIRSE